MRILHICLAAFYIDNYAYQENVLPRMHKRMGFDVRILASCESFVNNQSLGYVEPSSYINEDEIPVTRLPYRRWIPFFIAKKLRYYMGVSEYLEDYKPDLIFLHDIQFLDLIKVIKYKDKHESVVIVADGHTDYVNSARGFISKNILHGMIYKNAIRRSEKYISKFYGTLPLRNQFMREMYNIPKAKLEYLPLGVDDEKTVFVNHTSDKEMITSKYHLDINDYLVVTGGKLDSDKKNVLKLMDAVAKLQDVSLLIFGTFSKEIESQAKERLSEKIVFAGWQNEADSMRILSAADIVIFPYLHSTLWEQTAGIGTPLVVKSIPGFDHVNINGNCSFLESCDPHGIMERIKECMTKDEELKALAMEARDRFMYSKIAKRVIDEYEVLKKEI